MSTVVKGLTFSRALLGLQAGERLQREGWNGKGMWLALVKGATVQQSIGDCYGNNGETFPVLDAVYMKTADGSLVPWLCSQTDMLANDWQTLPDESKSDEPEVIHVFLDPNKPIVEQIEEAINKSINNIGTINTQENVKQNSYFTVSWYSYRQNEDCVEGNTVGIFSTVQKAKEAMKQGFLCTIESLEDSDLTVVNTENSVEITTNNLVCKYYIQELKID